ncbi:MAG: O-antigen ligase family protein, partial [Chloroflexi bacterium]|nr:O-antigen ligase family protein [Chloroflexota bacterium]
MSYLVESLEQALNSTLGGRRLRPLLLALFSLLLASSIARGITRLPGKVGLGDLMQSFLPTLLLLAAIAIIATADLDGFSLRWRGRGLSLKQLVAIGILAVPLAYFAAYTTTLPWGYEIDRMTILFGGLSLLGLGGAILLTLQRDDAWGVAVFLATEPLMAWVEWQKRSLPFAGGNWGPFAMSPRVMALLLFASILLLHRVTTGNRIVLTPAAKYIGLWGFFLLASSFLSADPWTSFQTFSMDAVYVPLFFLMVVNAVRSKRDAVPIILGIMLFGFLRVSFAGYGTVLHTGSLEFYSQNFSKVYQETFSVTTLGYMTTLTLPFCLALFLHYFPKPKAFLFGLGAVWLLVLILASETRAPLVGLASFPLLLLVLRGGHGKYALAIAIASIGLLTLAYFWVFSAQVPLEHYFRTGTLSTSLRLDMWQAALQAIKENPVFGIGLGMWHSYYPPLAAQLDWGSLYITDPHNLFLHYGSAGGIGALVGYLGIVASSIWAAYRLTGRAQDPKVGNMAAFLFWGLLMFVL